MGGTGTHYDKNAQNGLVEFFYGTHQPGTKLYVNAWTGTVTEVATSALIKRTEWYAVIRWRHRNDTEFREWFGAVTTLTWSRGYENLCYREEEEGMGPRITNAPRAILDKLTELRPLKRLSDTNLQEIGVLTPLANTDRHAYGDPNRQAADRRLSELDPDRSAREWRSACWDALIARTARPGLKDGDLVRFSAVMHFKTFTENTFHVIRPAGSRSFRFRPVSQPHIRAKLTSWRDTTYTVITGD